MSIIRIIDKFAGDMFKAQEGPMAAPVREDLQPDTPISHDYGYTKSEAGYSNYDLLKSSEEEDDIEESSLGIGQPIVDYGSFTPQDDAVYQMLQSRGHEVTPYEASEDEIQYFFNDEVPVHTMNDLVRQIRDSYEDISVDWTEHDGSPVMIVKKAAWRGNAYDAVMDATAALTPGGEHEMEHSDTIQNLIPGDQTEDELENAADQIAIDHTNEDSNYYEKLDKIESRKTADIWSSRLAEMSIKDLAKKMTGSSSDEITDAVMKKMQTSTRTPWSEMSMTRFEVQDIVDKFMREGKLAGRKLKTAADWTKSYDVGYDWATRVFEQGMDPSEMTDQAYDFAPEDPESAIEGIRDAVTYHKQVMARKRKQASDYGRRHYDERGTGRMFGSGKFEHDPPGIVDQDIVETSSGRKYQVFEVKGVAPLGSGGDITVTCPIDGQSITFEAREEGYDSDHEHFDEVVYNSSPWEDSYAIFEFSAEITEGSRKQATYAIPESGDTIHYYSSDGEQTGLVSDVTDEGYVLDDGTLVEETQLLGVDAKISALLDPDAYEQIKNDIVSMIENQAGMQEIGSYFEAQGMDAQTVQQAMIDLVLDGRLEGSTDTGFKVVDPTDNYFRPIDDRLGRRKKRATDDMADKAIQDALSDLEVKWEMADDDYTFDEMTTDVAGSWGVSPTDLDSAWQEKYGGLIPYHSSAERSKNRMQNEILNG